MRNGQALELSRNVFLKRDAPAFQAGDTPHIAEALPILNTFVQARAARSAPLQKAVDVCTRNKTAA